MSRGSLASPGSVSSSSSFSISGGARNKDESPGMDPVALAAATALYAATSGLNSGKGAGQKRLPMGLYFDHLRGVEEVKLAHAMESEAFEHGDAAPFERFK